jgi:hypothetical protein
VFEITKTNGSYASTPTTLVNFNSTNGGGRYLQQLDTADQQEPSEALKTKTMRLSPLGPRTIEMQGGTAHAHYFLGRYDEAASWAGDPERLPALIGRWSIGYSRRRLPPSHSYFAQVSHSIQTSLI